MKKENKNKLMILSLLLLLLVVVGATYAFFAAQRGTGGSANINVEAGTTDSLTFTNGSAITIDANSDNFKSGEPNQEGDTTVSAHLVANNGNNTASETYNVYLNLIQNPFVYTKPDSPELILQVTDPEGQPLKALEDTSIKYVSVEDPDVDENPIQGFDITTATGLIQIKKDQVISATPSDDETNGKKNQDWQIKIILINHDYDQQVNTGKTFNAQAIITAGTLPNIKVETANITSDSMKVIATISDYENTIDKVEFKINGDEDKEWHQAIDEDDNKTYSYTFNNLIKDKKYEVSTKISFADSEVLKVIEESITAKKTLADACPNGGNLAECVISLYNKNSKYEDTKLYYHDSNLEDGANDLSYRYTGGDYEVTELAKANNYQTINDLIKLTCNGKDVVNNNDYCGTEPKYILNYNLNLENLTTLKETLKQAITDEYISDNNIKNYVCFGEECEINKDNLFRIIGVFKMDEEYQVKLVKADEADKSLLGDDGDFASQGTREAYNTYLGNHNDWPRYYWNNTTQTNTWSESKLNTHNLNETYLGKLGNWTKMIADTEWQVGGMTYPLGHEQGAHTAYENELGTLKTPLTHYAKIGMMYVTDYYYGAIKDKWSLPGSVSDGEDYRKAPWDNWLWLGDDFWFITPSKSDLTNAFDINTRGNVHTITMTNNRLAVRPSFYLNSNVNYVSGTGTNDDPIIIS